MHITGLEYLTFGVEDLAAAHQYLLDYGLDAQDYDPAVGGTYLALDGTGVIVRHSDHPGLPPLPPGAHSPCLRETHYGVADQATLAALHDLLGADREVGIGEDGSLHCLDDAGFAIAFQLSRRQPIQAPYLGFNVPGQAPGRAPNDCAADPAAEIKPRSLSHVVYFVEDVARAEAFYLRLGFMVTDRFNGLGPFLRPAGTQEHHTLFMLQSHNAHMVGCNHFTFHFGSASEVLQQGWRFQQKGYQSFWGPGRHIMGSNFFWYFNSPFGAAMEFDADMDHHDDSWVPRAMDPGADNSQIFLFEGRDKWAPGE
ncbi:VOC family protein [Pseudomonas oryzihabitans]|uniref:Catechol 2,3-dioxygenase-like lactoylglutathione lyase family enzyme n=1 Tax=Pseudomonas oryzihabitans TaxID=47885 RepID=A0AAJ2BMJ4_9PSED|nr:VOC family protein [Pseudomonas psychrotolerans]MDR6235232.1 catechol 2,3-dioxygenase-like lactoylglutathione lyase family enzyme [Pseudomonas psychrotolerans]MDR6355542.1 catechol 2,3-dioxygenase-like lactoylglutathione lyase family enzyme [Pseudomonas psychrotolerans]